MESSTDTLISSTDTLPSSEASDVSMEDVYASDSYLPDDVVEANKPPPPTSIKDYKDRPMDSAKMTAQRKINQLKHLGKIVESQYEKRTRKVRQFIQNRMTSVDDSEALQEGALEVRPSFKSYRVYVHTWSDSGSV